MNGDSSDLLSEHLALAGVHTASHRNTERRQLITDAARTADGACRSVERGEQAVSGPVDLTPKQCAETSQELAPGAISPFGELSGRIHDVGEKHGCENEVGLDRTLAARDEALDCAQDRISVADPREVVSARQLDELGTRPGPAGRALD